MKNSCLLIFTVLLINLSDGIDNVNSKNLTAGITEKFSSSTVADINSELSDDAQILSLVEKSKGFDRVIIGIFAKVKFFY